MLDPLARRVIDKPLNAAGQYIAQLGISANQMTLIGLAIGLGALPMIVVGEWGWALLAIALSRVADGLDGAIARATRRTDFGGYLDIVCDFVFYASVPLGFILLDLHANGAAGGALLAAFYVNGSSFLGYAILAERAKIRTQERGIKSLYYSAGLLEGTETISFFVLLCLFPDLFPVLAWGFASLCVLTTILRVFAAWKIFPNSSAAEQDQ